MRTTTDSSLLSCKVINRSQHYSHLKTVLVACNVTETQTGFFVRGNLNVVEVRGVGVTETRYATANVTMCAHLNGQY